MTAGRQSTCLGEMKSFILVNVNTISRPADVVDGRRWNSVVLDLARQRQLHSDIGVIVERVIIVALRAFSRYSDQSLVGDDRAPSVLNTALVVTLQGVDVVAPYM